MGNKHTWLRLLTDSIKKCLGIFLAHRHADDHAAETQNASADANHDAFFDAYHSQHALTLTEEQKQAVVCQAPHVLLVAAAGSGKSATIIAKLAFLQHQGVQADEILCLAYNKDAAGDLKRRIRKMHHKMGFAGNSVQAHTFHSYCLQVIAQVNQYKPSISPLATSDTALLDWIKLTTEALKQRQPRFARDFNQFMLLYDDAHSPITSFTTQDEYDKYMRSLNATRQYSATREQYEWSLQAINGQKVASLEERQIVNWLVINGVEFEYEKAYPLDTTTEQHRQYHPDFYYPEADLWHEHFALDRHGVAPEFISGEQRDYEDGVKWKRTLHQTQHTALLETYSYQCSEGTIFTVLEDSLRKHGVSLNPMPQHELDKLVEQSFNPDKAFATIMQCLRHMKTNHLSLDTVEKRFNQHKHPESMAFFKVFTSLYRAYVEHLADTQTLDFDDLLYAGSEAIASHPAKHPIKYILVDEAQDMSSARINVLSALMKKTGTQLFAVGDDWQSIYRFSGADIRFMTEFTSRYSPTQVLALTRTFRSNQGIVNVASAFIQQNPHQLNKQVSPAYYTTKHTVLLGSYSKFEEDAKCHQFLRGCQIRAMQAQEKRTVFILTRYNFQIPSNIEALNAAYPALNIRHSSIHRAKGLEADYVVVHHVNSGEHGFPAEKDDNPLLHNVMPPIEAFPYAEERRLLYVALTRAKHAVLLLYRQDVPSPFIRELAAYERVYGFHTELKGVKIIACPKCDTGQLGLKKGKYGVFYGCSNTAHCSFTQHLTCPECHTGKIVRKKNRQGKTFYACNGYPTCTHIYK